MTATLPVDVQRVFQRFITCELTTIDRQGRPITWPVNPYYRPGAPTIDVSTAVGYPKKADDAAANPHVTLLFSDPTGCGMERAPMVLVQGTAEVDDRDLDANRERYLREAAEKLPGMRVPPSGSLQRWFNWYFARIYLKVRPERVYVWEGGDAGDEPRLLDSHMEEVRSGHDEEPAAPRAEPEGGRDAWDRRIETLGSQHESAVISMVAPDGFPFSVRVPVSADKSRRVVRIEGAPLGVPFQPGLVCVTAHEHDEGFSWQRNFQVRGDLVEADGEWIVVPHRLVGGFENPPGSALARLGTNIRKVMRARRTAKRRLARRAA